MPSRGKPVDHLSTGLSLLPADRFLTFSFAVVSLSFLAMSDVAAAPDDAGSGVVKSTPMKAAADAYVLLASKNGMVPKEQKLTSTVAQKTPEAAKELSYLRIVTQPDGYTIELNGEAIGDSPLPGAWLVKPGRHELKFTDSDKQARTRMVNVKPGEVKTIQWPAKAIVNTESDSDGGLQLKPWTMSDIGAATAAGGLISLGIGAFFGLRSLDLADQASNQLIRETYRRDFNRLSDQASDMALSANIAYGIGAAALLSGLTLAIFGDGGLIAIQADDDEGAVIIGGEF